MASLVQVFEHSIALPLADARGSALTRERLWKGLMEFARQPQLYIEAMTSCTVQEESTLNDRQTLKRHIDFGAFSFSDTVTLIDGRQLITTVPAMKECPASFFSITLEKGEPFELKFTYREVFTAGVTNNPQIVSIRSQAWKNKDQAMVEKLLTRI